MLRINTITVMIFLGLFLSACTWMVQNIESTEVIAKISARRIGSEVQFRHPNVAKEIHKVCGLVLKDIEAGEPEALKYYVYKLLQHHIDDPMLAANIIDLIGLIEIKPNMPLDDDQILIIKTIAEGFISGIEISGGRYGSETA